MSRHTCADDKDNVAQQQQQHQLLLRRTATRTLPAQLRTLPVLTAALAEVRREWCAVVHARVNGDVMRVCARLVSQLKAIKSELVARMSSAHAQRDKAASEALLSTSLPSSSATAACARARADAQDMVALLLLQPSSSPSQPAAAARTHTAQLHDSDAQTHSPRALRRLARRVWVWCLVLGMATLDVDVLSSTLASAVPLFRTNSNNNNDGDNDSNSNNGDDDDDDSNSVAQACEAAAVWHAYDVDTCVRGGVCDAQLVHACTLIYCVCVRDNAAAERALRQWHEQWLCDCTDDKDDDDEKGATRATMSRRCFAQWVCRVVRCVACDDVVALRALLVSRVRDDDDSSSDSNNNSSTTAADDVAAYGVVLLLLRMLAVCVCRRQWTAVQLGNSFRPAASTTPSAADVQQQLHVGQQQQQQSSLPITCTRVQAMFLCHAHDQHALVSAPPWPLPASLVADALLAA